MAPITWAGLDVPERETLMALAALHAEFGPDAAWTSDAVAHVLPGQRACVAELGFLAMYGLAELMPDRKGYRLSGEGYAVIPESLEKARLRDHREEATQELREEQ